jgi:hypothetical protein
MADSIIPVFLFSLPRSGSTFVQRVLGTHPQVGTSAEPWILLSLLGPLQESGFYSWANNHLIRKAVKEFWATLPNGAATYRHQLKQFATGLYASSLSPPQTHFLDKTPRYHIVIDDIMHIFDSARFIFLWRNPLAIVSSLIDTWARGQWKLYTYEIDLYFGMQALVAAYEQNAARSYAVCYESLIRHGETEWPKLFDYLDLDMPVDLWGEFQKATIAGSMGDALAKTTKRVQVRSLDKWLLTFNNGYRKKWARRYLNWIGEQRLAVMGYDKQNLLRRLDSIPTTGKNLAADIFFSVAGQIAKYTEMRLVLERIRRATRNRKGYPIFPK